MTCRDLVDLIADALAGELPVDTRRLFEGHLQGCRACRDYLRSYSRTVDLLRRAFEDENDPWADPIPEDLIEAILGMSPGAPAPRRAVPGRPGPRRGRGESDD